MIIADEVTGLEQTSHPNTTDGAAATASPTKSPAKAKAKATESNSGSGGLFQKGFLNNANDKKKPKESSGKGGRGKAVDKGIDDALAGLKQSKENVAGAGTFPGMPPEMYAVCTARRHANVLRRMPVSRLRWLFVLFSVVPTRSREPFCHGSALRVAQRPGVPWLRSCSRACVGRGCRGCRSLRRKWRRCSSN